MFQVSDSVGKTIHIEDKVEVLDQGEAIVIAMFSPSEIQVQPASEGLPFVVSPDKLTVKESLINQILNLRSMDDFMKLVKGLADSVQPKKREKKKEASQQGELGLGEGEKKEEEEETILQR